MKDPHDDGWLRELNVMMPRAMRSQPRSTGTGAKSSPLFEEQAT